MRDLGALGMGVFREGLLYGASFDCSSTVTVHTALLRDGLAVSEGFADLLA
jgi:hypothetical protein